jgi:hypothetical protein
MTRKKAAPQHPTRRPYRTPELTVHGDLKTLTTAKGGSSADGTGKPRTKFLTGTNA